MSFDFSWDSLVDFGGGAVETVGEGIGDIFNGWVDAEVAEQRAESRDPETVNNAQIEQGTTTTGETINHVDQPPTQQGFTVNNTVLIAGGVVLFVLTTVVVIASVKK